MTTTSSMWSPTPSTTSAWWSCPPSIWTSSRTGCTAREKDGLERRSAQTALWLILDTITKLFAPILAFTCDEIWQAMPHREGDDPRNVVLNEMNQPFPDYALRRIGLLGTSSIQCGTASTPPWRPPGTRRKERGAHITLVWARKGTTPPPSESYSWRVSFSLGGTGSVRPGERHPHRRCAGTGERGQWRQVRALLEAPPPGGRQCGPSHPVPPVRQGGPGHPSVIGSSFPSD